MMKKMIKYKCSLTQVCKLIQIKQVQVAHMDLFGPTQYTSIGGNKYGFVIVDDYTRYTWAFFLVDKTDVFATFKSF